MDNSCGSCGVGIPKGQRYCSMCYGDPYYGNDGYYMNWLEEQQNQVEQEYQFDSDYEEQPLTDEGDPGNS